MFGEHYVPAIPPKGAFKYAASEPIRRWLAGKQMEIIRHVPFDGPTRREGRDWPVQAESMIGLYRLENLRRCIATCSAGGPRRSHRGRRLAGRGDHLHAGCARRLRRRRAPGVGGRLLRGPPKPDPERFPAEAGDKHWTWDQLAVSIEEVKANFERYGLLDDQVGFLPGWFKDTLPAAPIDRLAVLRLDGDMYGSTMDALEALYPKLSVGGYVIIDDYGNIAQCKEAVTDFRNANGIIDPIETIDWTGVYWQRLPDEDR